MLDFSQCCHLVSRASRAAQVLARSRCRSPPASDGQPPAGESMTLGCQVDDLHIFDLSSGDRIN